MAFTHELPRALSPSRLSDFQSCPRKYQYGSIERIPQPQTRATAKGRFAHFVFENLFKLASPERTLDAARSFVDGAREATFDEATRTDLNADDALLESMTGEVELIIDSYFAMEDPTKVTVEGIERPVRVTIDGAPLYGILDRLDRDPDGSLVIVDYKTGRAPRGQWAERAFANTELYAALVQADPEIGELPTKIRLLYVKEGIVHPKNVTPIVANARAAAATGAWKKITEFYERGEFTATPSLSACRFCAYKDRCKDSGVKVAE